MQRQRYVLPCCSPVYCVIVDGGRAARSLIDWLSRLTIDHASLSKRGTVPTPNRHPPNIWAPSTLFPYFTCKRFAHHIPFLLRRLWPPSISQDSDRFVAVIGSRLGPFYAVTHRGTRVLFFCTLELLLGVFLFFGFAICTTLGVRCNAASTTNTIFMDKKQAS